MSSSHHKKKPLPGIYQFRSFTKSSTFDPATGQETKLDPLQRETLLLAQNDCNTTTKRKDFLDEIIERRQQEEEMEEAARRELLGDEEDHEEKGSHLGEDENGTSQKDHDIGEASEASDGATKQVTSSIPLEIIDGEDDEVPAYAATIVKSSHALETAATDEHTLTDAEQKAEQQDDMASNDDGEPIVDEFEDLPLYERLQKQAELRLAQEEDSKNENLANEAQQYIPQGLSKEDVQYFEALRKASDTRERDAKLNQRLKQKTEQYVLSLQEQKRKRDQLSELFGQKQKRRRRNDEEVNLDDMIVTNDEQGSNIPDTTTTQVHQDTTTTTDEVVGLFAGYSSD